MKIQISTVTLLFILLTTGCQKELMQVKITIDPAEVVGTIDERVYGHFYEHIYHSANGGLWGDMIWNRSFEEYPSGGKWSIENEVLSQSNLLSDIKLIFGDNHWTDYELNLEAKKTGGYEAFLILLRAVDEENFYWFNIGGWGNTRHVLEKETEDNRTVISDFVEGSIDDNRWYKIRMKCEGKNIKGWIDGKLVLDYTDDSNPHLNGAIGLGSWSTKVHYRNIKVNGLNGETLFEGLPRLSTESPLPRHWTSFGGASVVPNTQKPLNSEYCLQFKETKDLSGICQDKISVKANVHYNGSIWIKGSSGDKITVRLSTDSDRLAENILTDFTSEWKEYPIHFLPLESTNNAYLHLIVESTGELYIDQISLMSQESANNDGFNPELFTAVDQLKPPVIRWPGGCYAELYRWKDGIGPQHKRGVFPVNIWDDKDVNSLGTDEFITMCRKLDSDPLIVINAGFHEGAGTPQDWAPWIREACEWIEYCNGSVETYWGSIRAQNGHTEPYNVKFWEIDNELWRSKVPDARVYSEAVKLFSVAMREVDPSIVVIAHGGNGIDEKWNDILIENSAEYFDILSVHHYMDPDKFNEGVYEQESFYERTAKTMAASDNPEMKLYISEWNAQTTDWRTGLYAGGLLNAFERCGNFLTMGGPALFLRHTSANSWDNAFINFDHTGWFPAPNYVVMKLWRENYAPSRIKSTCDDDDINLVSTLSADGKTAICKIVNPTDLDKEISIEIHVSFDLRNVGFQIIVPDSLNQRNSMENPNSIIPTDGIYQTKGQLIKFEMPAYSAGVLRIGLR